MKREESARAMVDAARAFYAFGWLMGTSGNLSIRQSATTFMITASGKDKGRLELDDFLICDLDGDVTETTEHRPSAETLVHCVIYRALPDVGAIYHVHEPYAALCSDRDLDRGATRFSNLEMIKGLDIWDADAVELPIVPNHRVIPELAAAIGEAFEPSIPGVMVHNHGFYAWGEDATAAKRHVESLAYLYKYSWLREAR